MDLKKYMVHNTDIPYITEWVAKNLNIEDFKELWEGNFCGCDPDTVTTGYVYVIDLEDEMMMECCPHDIVQIMERHNLFKLVVMYCHECGQWGIDGDW